MANPFRRRVPKGIPKQITSDFYRGNTCVAVALSTRPAEPFLKYGIRARAHAVEDRSEDAAGSELAGKW